MWNNVSVQQAKTFAQGSNESCQVTQAFKTIMREANGTSYYVDGSGIRHWIPNGGVFSCLYYWDGVSMWINVSVEQAYAFARGSKESCQVSQSFNTIIREADGTSYYVDGSGTRH